MPAGRPTDWTPTLGDEILSLMTEGLSLAAAAAEVGIHRQRVYEWMERHPEFADTVKLAQGKRQLFLERRLLTAGEGPIVTSSIFALKNAAPDDWRDKREIEATGKDGEKLIPEETSSRDLAKAIAALLAKGMKTGE